MARLLASEGRALGAALALLAGLSVASSGVAGDAPVAALYDRPVLVIDPGMHTAPIPSAASDAAGRFVVTGSHDKTVRVWSAEDGKLLQTIRIPAGSGNVGKIYSVAINPQGTLIAAGGWAADAPPTWVYLFERSSGKLIQRIPGLPQVTQVLAFSADGQYLAAGLGDEGLRVFDRDKNWAEAFRDEDYGSDMYGLAFAADGRLAASSFDGSVRLYDSGFRLLVKKEAPSGLRPRGVAFHPKGEVLALGYHDSVAVDLLNARTLEPLPKPAAGGLRGGNLEQVAWSSDGGTLFAGGTYGDPDTPVVAWDEAGHAPPRVVPAGHETVGALVSLPDNQLLVAQLDPYLALLQRDGTIRWAHGSPQALFSTAGEGLNVSSDGTVFDFSFDRRGKSPLRFDVRALKLTDGTVADARTAKPIQSGLPIEHWDSYRQPMLDGKPIAMLENDVSRSLAIHPQGDRFVLGTSYRLYAFKSNGERLWQDRVPSEALAVNISGDGRLVVAAYADGTIRWHRMDDGRELLAFRVLGDKKNWVVWTPEGFYAATPGAHGVLQWHVNRGVDAAGIAVAVSEIRKSRRPDAIPLILQELETARALGIADMTELREAVQVATGAASAPGARLHLLAIGINDYGEKAKHLHLDYAGKDAQDVAAALVNTQRSEFSKLGSLYADVLPILIRDADKAEIFEAFASLQRNMARGAGQDLAVVMFAGHGVMIDSKFYLLPHGVDASTAARLKASAISADEVRGEIDKLAENGRVLVLLDACHSGAATGEGTTLETDADQLRRVVARGNVTVLTSSSGSEPSREDPAWQNGAFTKVLLEGLGKDADTDHNGLISITELTNYLTAHLPDLTRGRQHPGIEMRFQADVFVAGL